MIFDAIVIEHIAANLIAPITRDLAASGRCLFTGAAFFFKLLQLAAHDVHGLLFIL